MKITFFESRDRTVTPPDGMTPEAYLSNLLIGSSYATSPKDIALLAYHGLTSQISNCDKAREIDGSMNGCSANPEHPIIALATRDERHPVHTGRFSNSAAKAQWATVEFEPGDFEKGLKDLVKKGYNPNFRDGQNYSANYRAAHAGNAEAVSTLKGLGARVLEQGDVDQIIESAVHKNTREDIGVRMLKALKADGHTLNSDKAIGSAVNAHLSGKVEIKELLREDQNARWSIKTPSAGSNLTVPNLKIAGKENSR